MSKKVKLREGDWFVVPIDGINRVLKGVTTLHDTTAFWDIDRPELISARRLGIRRPVTTPIPRSARGSHAKVDGYGRAGDDDRISSPRLDRSLTLRGARPRYPIAQVIVTVAEPRYRAGASGPVAPGSAPAIELPDPTATPGWGAASIIG
jgi:hypothetical protein